jgi:hypothetical protein
VKVTKCPPAYDPELEYDRWQFGSQSSAKDLLGLMDWTEAMRMQIFETSTIRKKIPDWALDSVRLRIVLMAHPQAEKLAPKWARIVYLYYFKQYTAKDVAETMGMHEDAVERVLRCLNRRAEQVAESGSYMDAPESKIPLHGRRNSGTL